MSNADPPLSHDPHCPYCDHPWHLLICGVGGCTCAFPPIPGIYVDSEHVSPD